ncbi:hypothetical protein ACWKT5_26265 [Streptomyces avermitilis]
MGFGTGPKKVMLRMPLRHGERHKDRLTSFGRLGALSLDALSQVAYRPEAIVLVVVAGTDGHHLISEITRKGAAADAGRAGRAGSVGRTPEVQYRSHGEVEHVGDEEQYAGGEQVQHAFGGRADDDQHDRGDQQKVEKGHGVMPRFAGARAGGAAG